MEIFRVGGFFIVTLYFFCLCHRSDRPLCSYSASKGHRKAAAGHREASGVSRKVGPTWQ